MSLASSAFALTSGPFTVNFGPTGLDINTTLTFPKFDNLGGTRSLTSITLFL